MNANVKNTKRNKTPHALCRTPLANALPHGLNSGSVLLPGDNVEAFRRLRQREFQLNKPRNIEEARCVETITAAHWRIERCRVEQRIFKRHLGAVLSGDPDVTGPFVDADPHRLHHRGTDCGKEERRLEASMREAKADLAAMQKQRAENVAALDGSELEDYRVFMAEGEPIVAEETPVEAETAPKRSESTRSEHGRILKSLKRRARAGAAGLPRHGRQRSQHAAPPPETMARQEAAT